MIVISGPSSVGKNVAIVTLRSRYGVRFATPVTTRARRPEEIPGEDYHFVDTVEFQDLIASGDLDEWDFALGHYYGFPSGTFASDGPPLVTHSLARMALRVRRRFQSVSLVFLKPGDDAVQSSRLEARFPDPEERRRRLDHWREELEHAPLFDRQLVVSGGSDVLDPKYESLWTTLAQGG